MNVSNKAVHAYINYIIENNDDPKSFFESLGYDYTIMSDENKYMTWKDYQVITEALNTKYSRFYEGMTKHGLTNKFVKQVLDILSRMISFRLVGDFILKFSFKTFYLDTVKIELIKTGKKTFDIKLYFNSAEDIFPVFVDMYETVFLALPKLVSESLSWDITITQSDNILTYHVTEGRKASSLFVSFQTFILKLFKLDRYYQNLIIENLQHSNDLERKNLELEKAEKRISEAHKDVLLANRIISHDIANKMQIVEHVRRLIARGEIDKASEKLDVYYESVKGIIENTRNFIDESGSSFKQSEVVIKGLIDELIFDHSEQANQKDIVINVNFNTAEDFKIITNKEALKDSVLANILQNAIKFSKQNSKINLSFSKEGDEVKFICEDFGVGIDPSLVNDINQSTEDILQSTVGTHGETGRGLGLFIMKKVCRDLGFQVRFESEVGKTTRVSVTKNLV